MAKYVNIEAIENQLLEKYPMGYYREDLAEAVEAAEGEDVAPVVHGHWEPIIDPDGNLEGWLCGCGRETKEMSNYCPRCGAKMDWGG